MSKKQAFVLIFYQQLNGNSMSLILYKDATRNLFEKKLDLFNHSKFTFDSSISSRPWDTLIWSM